jgi:predicted transposase/invertase (TIGR01784 family)
MIFTNKLLDPKNDIAFKRIFGTERNKDILIHFLNDMLVFKNQQPIVDVTFLSPILEPEIYSQKTSIVDVLCKDANDKTYIVEMQVAKTRGFEKRAQFYASKAYCSQAHVGDNYENLQEVVFLAIADYVMFPHKKALKSDHVILDKESLEHDLTDFSFTFLELGKFKKTKDEIDSLTDLVEKWCYFFKYAEDVTHDDVRRLISQDVVIEKAYAELNRFNWTDDELMSYDAVIKRERDHLAILAQRFDEGLEKGLQQGIEKGKVEERTEVALKMLTLKIDDATIMGCLNMTHEEVSALKTRL